MIDAYLDLLTTSGGVIYPESLLVTGYDFLADVADAIADEFSDPAGLNGAPPPTVDTLVAPADTSPLDPDAWTALRSPGPYCSTLHGPHEMGFLAGHFSANAALAADFETHLMSTDLVASTLTWQTPSSSAPAAILATTSSMSTTYPD